jgi:alanine-synthesizing transaminase
VFSDRLRWDRPENALAVVERGRREAGLPVVDLTESNPTRVGLPYPVEALRQALGAGAADRYEPAPSGLPSARDAVVADYRANGHAIERDQVVLTASSSESYSLLFKLLCNPDDAVLVPEPSYPLFEYLARLDGVRPVGYRLIYDGQWHIDFDSLAAAYARAARTGAAVRALVVVNPNNPTGSFISESDLAQLGALCGSWGIAVISDEVFAPYRFVDRADAGGAVACLATAPAIASRALTFSLGGLSKACGLPHLKLGWIVVAGPADFTRTALAHLELIADTYLSVGGPVQRALPRLLQLGVDIRRVIQQRVRENRAALIAALSPTCPCTLLDAQGGWTAILRVPDLGGGGPGDGNGGGDGSGDESWATRLLREDGILIHPGYLFDMPAGAYLIASLLPDRTDFSRAIERVLARCADSVP